MIARIYARSLAVARWSRERIQNHLRRRLLKPKLSGFLLYLIILALIFVASFSSLASYSLKEQENDRWKETASESQKPRADVKRDRTKRSVRGVVSPHNYHLMISNSRLCADAEEVKLLVLVTSAASHFDRRQAIRSTWGQPLYLQSFKTYLVFLLANPNDSKIQRKIVEEYRSFGDTIQEDFTESYLNLTLKTIMGVKWASNYCSKAAFVLKTDDDIFVNVPLLTSHLSEMRRERPFFTGCIKQKNSLKPVNAEAGSLIPSVHPLFAAGAGYVFSGVLSQSILEASLRTRIVPVEDVYVTGHLAKAVGVHPPLHDHRFSCGEIVADNCLMQQMFTGHKVNPEKMHKIWTIFDPKSKRNACNTRKH